MIGRNTLSISTALAGLAGVATLAFAIPGAAQDLENPDSAFVDNMPPQVWIAKVEKTERGHRIGKPDAEAQLIEFISYTCGHCASFAREGGPTLDLAAVGPGHVSVEVRPVIRNGLDLVVTMLAQCGDPAGFKDRHRLFLYSQDAWLTKAMKAPRTQQAVWARGDAAARTNAAQALDLDDMLAERGLTKPQINACLADDAAASAILSHGRADATEFGFTGTPSFALDGELLNDVHNWRSLSGVLQTHFEPAAKGE